MHPVMREVVVTIRLNEDERALLQVLLEGKQCQAHRQFCDAHDLAVEELRKLERNPRRGSLSYQVLAEDARAAHKALKQVNDLIERLEKATQQQIDREIDRAVRDVKRRAHSARPNDAGREDSARG